MRSDNGSNFIGARRELKEALAEMDRDQVKVEMLKGCDWFEVKFNVPSASHMGGIWERQHLTNEFWLWWKKEFLLSLQERQKWTKPRKNLQVNDVVIIKEDDVPRNQWRVCRVVEALPDEDGLVRKVKLEVGNWNLATSGKRSQPLATLERPIHKLVLLMSAEDE